MSDYGIIVKDKEGRTSLHSSYSNLIYIGKITSVVSTNHLWATGENYKEYSTTNYYNVVYTSTYSYTLPKDLQYIVPFYKPKYLGQKIAPVEMNKEGDTWKFIVSHEDATSPPDIYLFCLMSELNPTLTDSYGLNVYKPDGVTPVFSTEYKPLKATQTLFLDPPYEETNASNEYTMGVGNTAFFYTTGISSDTMFSWQSNSFGNKYYTKDKSGTTKKKCKGISVFGACIGWTEAKPWASNLTTWTHFASCISIYNTKLAISHVNTSGGKYYEFVTGDTVYGVGPISMSVGLKSGIGLKIDALGTKFLDINFNEDVDTPKTIAPQSSTNRYKSTIMLANASDYD